MELCGGPQLPGLHRDPEPEEGASTSAPSPREAQRRRTLRPLKTVMVHFYTSIIESILCSSSTVSVTIT